MQDVDDVATIIWRPIFEIRMIFVGCAMYIK